MPRAYLKRLGILPITTLASQTRCTGANPHGAALPQRTVCWKTLLVCSEQGLGDAVRLAPYLHRLSELADTVIMEFDPRMLPIYQRSIPVIKLYPFRRTRVRDRMRFTYDWLRKFPTPNFHGPYLACCICCRTIMPRHSRRGGI